MSHNIGEKGTVMIEIQNLTKVFQEQTVLQNINATFDAGLIHGVIGKNGAGKSRQNVIERSSGTNETRK